MATTAQPQTGAKTGSEPFDEEILRYIRTESCPAVGMEGKLKLKKRQSPAHRHGVGWTPTLGVSSCCRGVAKSLG